MKAHLTKFLIALDQGQFQTCKKLCELEGVLSREAIIAESIDMNNTLLPILKENLQTIKGTQICEFLYSAYSRASARSAYFDDQSLFKDEGETSSSEGEDNAQQCQRRLEGQGMNLEVFLLCISQLAVVAEEKERLCSILKVISLFADDKYIQTICRRQKILSNFLKVFTDSLLKAPSNLNVPSQSVTISALAAHLLAKLLHRNKKNQDYMIQKRSHELFKPILASGEANPMLFTGAAGILSNLANSSDSRLLLWTSGILTITKQILSTATNPQVIEYSYLLILKLSSECKEIVDDLKADKSFMDSLSKILASQDYYDIATQTPESLGTYAQVLGIVRRIAGFSDIRAEIAKQFYKYPVSFIQRNSDISKSSQNQLVHLFTVKEALALIGVLIIDDNSRKLVIASAVRISTMIIQLTLNLFNEAKIVKIALGCLTNLSVEDSSRLELSMSKEFYITIYSVLEKYDYNAGILEYCLKMILNNCSNSVSLQNFSAPKMILKLLFLMFAYQQHILIVDLASKILKILSSNPLVLQNIIRCYREYEQNNPQYRFSKVLVNSLKSLQSNGMTESVLENILFLASICPIDKNIVSELQANTDFLTLIKDILETKRKNPQELQRISSTLAYLPLEEFKGFSLL